MAPKEAYLKAIKSGYTKELEEIACKDPEEACRFSLDIPGADIKYCQEHACKDTRWAYYFACVVKGADIEYCQEWACKDPEYAYWFSIFVSGADLNYCLEACKGTEWYAKVQVHIMEEALG